MSELSPTNRSWMSLSEPTRSPSTTAVWGKCGWRLSEVCAFTTCHIWAGFTSLECESFLTLSLFLNGICAEGEKDLFFTVYLQISCPVSLCLQKSKFNIPLKRKTQWNSSFHNTKWLVESICLIESIGSGVDAQIMSDCSMFSLQWGMRYSQGYEWVMRPCGGFVLSHRCPSSTESSSARLGACSSI